MIERRKRFIVVQRTEWLVLGPNAGASTGAYLGEHLLVCTTENREDAELIAAALNAYPAAQCWLDRPN